MNVEDQQMSSSSAPDKPKPLAKNRAPEFYGFVAWASTSALFVVYILWALFPDEWIEALGVDWYPNREWSILIPAWSIMVLILTYISYWSLALLGTPELSDLSTVTDTFVQLPPDHDPTVSLASTGSNSIPHLYDLPIGVVNRVLYRRANQPIS